MIMIRQPAHSPNVFRGTRNSGWAFFFITYQVFKLESPDFAESESLRMVGLVIEFKFFVKILLQIPPQTESGLVNRRRDFDTHCSHRGTLTSLIFATFMTSRN